MLILDAANLLHAAHGMAWPMSELDRHGLVKLVGAQRLGKRGAEVVFDGVRPEDPPPEDPEGLVRLRWSGRGREADDLIEELIEIDSAPSRLLVVSTDRRIRASARRAGATSETSRDFLNRAYRAMLDRAHRLPPPKVREEVPLGRDMLRVWLREFGFDPGLADRVPERGATTTPMAPPTPDMTKGEGRTAPVSATPAQQPAGQPSGQPTGQPATPPMSLSSAETPPKRGRKTKVVIDDELAALIKEWGGIIEPADLDMQTWIGPNPHPGPTPGPTPSPSRGTPADRPPGGPPAS